MNISQKALPLALALATAGQAATIKAQPSPEAKDCKVESMTTSLSEPELFGKIINPEKTYPALRSVGGSRRDYLTFEILKKEFACYTPDTSKQIEAAFAHFQKLNPERTDFLESLLHAYTLRAFEELKVDEGIYTRAQPWDIVAYFDKLLHPEAKDLLTLTPSDTSAKNPNYMLNFSDQTASALYYSMNLSRYNLAADSGSLRKSVKKMQESARGEPAAWIKRLSAAVDAVTQDPALSTALNTSPALNTP